LVAAAVPLDMMALVTVHPVDQAAAVLDEVLDNTLAALGPADKEISLVMDE
jgi:hypothetical protein